MVNGAGCHWLTSSQWQPVLPADVFQPDSGLAVLDFEIQRCSRSCSETEREFEPGEAFYSVLVADGAEVLRHDFSEEAWSGPPEKCLGWWKSHMPERDSSKVHWAPNDVMLHYFEQLEDQPGRQDVRFVMALLMLRRRLVRLEETTSDEQDSEVMVLYCPRNEKTYEVDSVTPKASRIDKIQQELAELLFAKAS